MAQAEQGTNMDALQPFQKRVIAEKDELDERRLALDNFIGSNIFPIVPAIEQDALRRQSLAMLQYSIILGERIRRF